jgi:hypothetical protein
LNGPFAKEKIIGLKEPAYGMMFTIASIGTIFNTNNVNSLRDRSHGGCECAGGPTRREEKNELFSSIAFKKEVETPLPFDSMKRLPGKVRQTYLNK